MFTVSYKSANTKFLHMKLIHGLKDFCILYIHKKKPIKIIKRFKNNKNMFSSENSCHRQRVPNDNHSTSDGRRLNLKFSTTD